MLSYESALKCLKPNEMARPLDRTIPVKRGARQGAIASPCYFNNYVLKTQDQCEMSSGSSGLNISLVTYANDIFNISRTSDIISETFYKLQSEYLNLTLQSPTSCFLPGKAHFLVKLSLGIQRSARLAKSFIFVFPLEIPFSYSSSPNRSHQTPNISCLCYLSLC